MKKWNVYGECIMCGIKAETKEEAISIARALASDPIEALSYLDAVEIVDDPDYVLSET